MSCRRRLDERRTHIAVRRKVARAAGRGSIRVVKACFRTETRVRRVVAICAIVVRRVMRSRRIHPNDRHAIMRAAIMARHTRTRNLCMINLSIRAPCQGAMAITTRGGRGHMRPALHLRVFRRILPGMATGAIRSCTLVTIAGDRHVTCTRGA